MTALSILFISFYLYTRLPHTPHPLGSPFSISLFHCLLCCPTCSKNGLFTSASPPISWPEVKEMEEVVNPTHLKQPIRAGHHGGTVDHVTLLYWVSVFLISPEGSRQFLAQLWPTVNVKIKSSSSKLNKRNREISPYITLKTTAKSKYNSILLCTDTGKGSRCTFTDTHCSVQLGAGRLRFALEQHRTSLLGFINPSSRTQRP